MLLPARPLTPAYPPPLPMDDSLPVPPPHLPERADAAVVVFQRLSQLRGPSLADAVLRQADARAARSGASTGTRWLECVGGGGGHATGHSLEQLQRVVDAEHVGQRSRSLIADVIVGQPASSNSPHRAPRAEVRCRGRGRGSPRPQVTHLSCLTQWFSSIHRASSATESSSTRQNPRLRRTHTYTSAHACAHEAER